METPKSPQKDILHDVFRILPPAKASQAEAEHQPFKPLDEPPHRRFITGHAALDQQGVGLDHTKLAINERRTTFLSREYHKPTGQVSN